MGIDGVFQFFGFVFITTFVFLFYLLKTNSVMIPHQRQGKPGVLEWMGPWRCPK